jgi:beta-xylosidase
MHWHDGWPVIGVDQDMNGIGEPVPAWRMPEWELAKSESKESCLSMNYSGSRNSSLYRNSSLTIATSDEFNTSDLGLQWQWNHNPVDEAWSLTERKGHLTLHALPSESFKKARNTLTQKSMGYTGEFTIKLNVSALKDGDHAGLACMGKTNHQVGVKKEGGKLYVYVGEDEATASDKFKKATNNELQATSSGLQTSQNSSLEAGSSSLVTKSTIYLRLHLDGLRNVYSFSYSYADNDKFFTPIGEPFAMKFGHWKGVRPALFCYNTMGEGGKAMVDWVRYRIKD